MKTIEDKLRNKVIRERISEIKQEIKYHKQLEKILLNNTSFVNRYSNRAERLRSQAERTKLNKLLKIWQQDLIENKLQK